MMVNGGGAAMKASAVVSFLGNGRCDNGAMGTSGGAGGKQHNGGGALNKAAAWRLIGDGHG